MHGMLLAESAVLLCFHTVRMSFLVLSHVVVALFAFCTCQCNFCAHDFHLHLYYRSSHLPLRYLILSIKKRPKLFHSPVYYTIEMSVRQGIFADLWGPGPVPRSVVRAVCCGVRSVSGAVIRSRTRSDARVRFHLKIFFIHGQ